MAARMDLGDTGRVTREESTTADPVERTSGMFAVHGGAACAAADRLAAGRR